jgi:hypothetical protein
MQFLTSEQVPLLLVLQTQVCGRPLSLVMPLGCMRRRCTAVQIMRSSTHQGHTQQDVVQLNMGPQ